MYLKVQGDKFSKHIFREIEIITDQSVLDCNSVVYNKDRNEVSFIVVRYPIKSDRKFLGTITPYSRCRDIEIHSKIIVRNVTNCKTDNNIGVNDRHEVTLLFGVKVNTNEIYLSSAEECHGVPSFSITLQISSLDLEISDLFDETFEKTEP